MQKNKNFFLTVIFLTSIVFVPEILMVLGAENQDDSILDTEVNLTNIINEVKNPEKYDDFVEPFVESNTLWPALLPKNLSSNAYLQSFKFNLTGFLTTDIPLGFGDIYRNDKLTATNYSTLLIFEPTTFNNFSVDVNLHADVFENYSWSHRIYIDYTKDNVPNRITLSLRSPIDNEGQIWNGWIMWSYDESGVAYRFEILVWCIAAELVNDFDITTDQLTDLTAYYNIVFQTNSEIVGDLAFVIVFMGSIGSLMITPFVTIGFIVRRPIKRFTLKENVLSYDYNRIKLFYRNSFGIIKIFSGFLINLPLILLPIIFPSIITVAALFPIFLMGFLWFGLYLLLKTFIELQANVKVKKISVFILSIISLCIGSYGVVNLQTFLPQLYNPEDWLSVVVVSGLYYGVTLGSFMGMIMIYEGFYKTSWSHSQVSKLFVIERKHPLSNSIEIIPESVIKQISLDSSLYKSRYGNSSNVNLIFQLDEMGNTRSQNWKLKNKDSIINLLKTVDYLSNSDFQSVFTSNIPGKLISSEYSTPEFDKKLKLYEKYPELKKERHELPELVNNLQSNNFSIDYPQTQTAIISHENYPKLLAKGFLLNFVFLCLSFISLVAVTAFMNYLVSLLSFDSLNRATLTVIVIPAVFSIGCLVLLAKYIIKLPVLIFRRPLVITLTDTHATITINNKEEVYPIELLHNLKRKRDKPFNHKICMDNELGEISFILISNKQLAEYLVQFISLFIQKTKT